MRQGNGLYLQRTVFIDNLMDGCIDSMELDVVARVLAEERKLGFEHRSQFLRGMYMERCRSPQHAKSTEHAYQTEAVVAMQMRDKDMTQLGETHRSTTQLHLRTFATIYHELLATTVHDLRRCVMPKGGKRTSTPQDMYSERFHNMKGLPKIVFERRFFELNDFFLVADDLPAIFVKVVLVGHILIDQ